MSSIKRTIKAMVRPFIPKPIRALRLQRALAAQDAVFAQMSPQEAFSLIYEKKLWGDASQGDFYSGTGSHDPSVTDVYVKAVCAFLSAFRVKPNVVDLGCGDFNVGRQIRPYCGQYTACDVVPALIERNKVTFVDHQVDFICLDLTKEPLPSGNILFIRQVLQHLSNDQIQALIPKLPQFEFLILTEHLPLNPDFIPNQDKPIGAGIRLGRGIDSGIVLTKAPFHLNVLAESVLCEAPESGGIIRTILYKLH